jgi:hypothetical protein
MSDPFKGTQVNKLEGGLGRKAANKDSVALLVIASSVAASSLAVNVAKKVLDLTAAEGLGIDASYDDTNDVLAHHHISEVFRINPDADLYVMLSNGTSREDNILEAVRTFPDIKIIAFAATIIANPTAIATEVASFQTAIVAELLTDKILIDTCLIAGDVILPTTAPADYPSLRTLDSENVSVIIAQDPKIASIKSAYANYAAIGTALGALTRRGVNENLGSVDINNKPTYAKGLDYFSLTDVGRELWMNASLQSGKTIASLTSAERSSLNEMGYNFVANYAGYNGFYFSNSLTATAATSDYAYIENNRVWNKAARGVRNALLPRVKSNILKDPTTGFIKATEAKELEVLAEKPLREMVTAGEISGFDVYVNPEQALISETPLKVTGEIVYNGIVFAFDFDLGGAQSISN